MEDYLYLGFFFSAAKLQIKAKPWENNLDFIINVPVQTFVYEGALTKTIKTPDCWQTLWVQSICLRLALREQALDIQP